MKLGFTLGSIEITIFDTNTEPGYDVSGLTDQEIAEVVNPCLSGEQGWDPLSQTAFEEAVERDMVVYEGDVHVEGAEVEEESSPWWKIW